VIEDREQKRETEREREREHGGVHAMVKQGIHWNYWATAFSPHPLDGKRQKRRENIERGGEKKRGPE